MMLSRRQLLFGAAGVGLANTSTGTKGMVTAESGIAAGVGVEILRKGGNAIDAAIAVGFAEAVTWPQAGNIGGGGFMVLQTGNGKAAVIDYRETAPSQAHRDTFRDGRSSTVGHFASAVPGTVAGFEAAHRKYGHLRWSDLIAPAVALARDGFPLEEGTAGSLRRYTKLADFAESKRIFFRDGRPYEAGETLRQPELGATLERIARGGAREFYQGETAHLLVEAMKSAGGWIGSKDLASYRAIERQPLRGTYRGHDIVTAPPAASGGTLLLEMLNMLERLDWGGYPAGSAQRYHLLAEVMKRAYADRSAFLADPAFVKVPMQKLISKDYAAARARTIKLDRATPSTEIREGQLPRESADTTHYSVVDAQGNAVSNTYTLRNPFGSFVTVPGGGFLLNNVMDDFAVDPGRPNSFGFVAGEANAIASGKRPVSSQAPTIVNRNGKLWIALGAPGGPTIANGVMQVILNMIHDGMEAGPAVAAPRVHHQWQPDEIRYESMPPATVTALEGMGHRLVHAERMNIVEVVGVEAATGARFGASDPRNPSGKAIGQ